MKKLNAAANRYTDQNGDWGALELMRQQVIERNLDGFFVPYEWGLSSLPQAWDENSLISYYPCAGGCLLFRLNAFKRYGFEKESDFLLALRKSSISGKSATETLSLGAALCQSPQKAPIIISVFVKGKTVRLIFGAHDTAQAEEMTRLLREMFPADTRIYQTRNDFSFLNVGFSAVFQKLSNYSVLKQQIKELDVEKQSSLKLLGLFSLLSLAFFSVWVLEGFQSNDFWLFSFSQFLYLGMFFRTIKVVFLKKKRQNSNEIFCHPDKMR